MSSNEPSIKAIVSFKSLKDGRNVSREYVITKSDINDVEWYGGDTGDSFFDDEFDTDEARLEQRIEDCVHYNLWEFQSDDDIPPDPDLVGEHPEGLGYNDRLSIETDFGVYDPEDFYPED